MVNRELCSLSNLASATYVDSEAHSNVIEPTILSNYMSGIEQGVSPLNMHQPEYPTESLLQTSPSQSPSPPSPSPSPPSPDPSLTTDFLDDTSGVIMPVSLVSVQHAAEKKKARDPVADIFVKLFSD